MLATLVTLIPLTRNDGRPVPEVEQEAILGRLIATFGKLTIEGTVTGVWLDTESKKTYRDQSLKIVLGCSWDRVGELQTMLREIGKQLGQKEMYVELRSGTGIHTLRCDE